MPYWRLHYHLVWSTAERQPLITPERERILCQTVYAKARELRTTLHAIGGIEDHLHLVVSVPPTLSISECVKHWKGATARAVNRSEAAGSGFQWQGGYGALTIGGRSLASVIDYVTHQRQHHQTGEVLEIYEQIAPLRVPPSSRLQTT